MGNEPLFLNSSFLIVVIGGRMPGFLASTTIRHDELKQTSGHDVREKLAKVLKGRTLIECHGINHSVEVRRSARGPFLVVAEIEHRNYGDDSGPKYAAFYRITKARGMSYNVQLVGTEGADAAGSEMLAMQRAFFESEGKAWSMPRPSGPAS